MHREQLPVNVGLLMDKLKSVVSRLPADLDALGVAPTEVADGRLVVPRMEDGNLTRAGLDTQSAAGAFLPVHQDGAGLLVHGEGIFGAAVHAGVVGALRAEVGHLNPWEGHEHPDPGGLGPHPVLVVYAARELAHATAATVFIVSDYPD